MYVDSKGWIRSRSQVEDEAKCERGSGKWNVTRPGQQPGKSCGGCNTRWRGEGGNKSSGRGFEKGVLWSNYAGHLLADSSMSSAWFSWLEGPQSIEDSFLFLLRFVFENNVSKGPEARQVHLDQFRSIGDYSDAGGVRQYTGKEIWQYEGETRYLGWLILMAV